MKLFVYVNLYLLMVILPSSAFVLDEVFKEKLNNINASVYPNSACLNDLNTMIRAIGTADGIWALKILDSSSKIQSGIAILNEDIGQFDECIQAENKDASISGKYCLGYINPVTPNTELHQIRTDKVRLMQNVMALTGSKISSSFANQKFTWAGCLPKSCSINDFSYFYNNILQRFISGIEIDFSEQLCATKYDESSLSIGAILTIVFFCIMIGIMIIETFYDLYCQKFGIEPSIFLTAFSMYTNSQKLFKISKSNDQLQFLNGLKFFSMIWVVLGHTYSEAIQAPLSNVLDVLTWSNQLYSMLLVSGLMAVDTFFVVGGCLVAYVYMLAIEKGGNINIFIYYLHRFIRLTPPLGALILVVANITPYLGNGPRWTLIRTYQSFCQENWWSTLLYIQNYVSIPKVCAGHCWYLAIDMQLYILSPFIMYSMKRYTKLSFVCLGAVISIITGVNFYVAWIKKYGALVSNIYIDSTDYQSNFYLKTHVRAGPWLFGILAGYIIFEMKQKRLKFRPHKVLNIIAWLCSLVLLLFCIFIGHDFLRRPEYSEWGNSLHIAFIRNIWSIAICWIMVSCALGYGGPINWFLSLPIYQVLNRFTYSIYLVHLVLIDMWYSSTKTPIHFSDLMMGYYFWGHFCFTFIISYFWVLLFESPFIILEKIILGALLKLRRQKADT
ncbi:hypothetical protein WA026_006056 [Henosepilachna vigintioctopunctata]|uniref:Nose resistant-to-fluoxetine protein N-terminal domain-containing protein n=1 Tax=Henosepilachna vigintioctopunctata TaxID=420089 RepID=A0AAW1TNI6_9CUCU